MTWEEVLAVQETRDKDVLYHLLILLAERIHVTYGLNASASLDRSVNWAIYVNGMPWDPIWNTNRSAGCGVVIHADAPGFLDILAFQAQFCTTNDPYDKCIVCRAGSRLLIGRE